MKIITKPWGREYQCYRNDELAIWALEIERDKYTSLHAHPHKNTALVLLRGCVRLSFIRGDPIVLTALDKINIFRGRFHRSTALTDDVLMLEVEAPNDKRDILRLSDDYGRADLPLEEPDREASDGLNLTQFNRRSHYSFAGCSYRELQHDSGLLLDASDESVLICLTGSLEGGLVPAGDAIDAKSFKTIARKFKPLPGSSFLQIWKWS